MRRLILSLATLSTITLLIGCTKTTIDRVGEIGPGKLKVYSINSNGFLASSQMLVVLDRKGDVSAYTGGTASGWGTVALQTGGTVVTAGAIVYTGKAIQHGLEHASVSAGGVPKNFQLNVDSPILHKNSD